MIKNYYFLELWSILQIINHHTIKLPLLKNMNVRSANTKRKYYSSINGNVYVIRDFASSNFGNSSKC